MFNVSNSIFIKKSGKDKYVCSVDFCEPIGLTLVYFYFTGGTSIIIPDGGCCSVVPDGLSDAFLRDGVRCKRFVCLFIFTKIF